MFVSLCSQTRLREEAQLARSKAATAPAGARPVAAVAVAGAKRPAETPLLNPAPSQRHRSAAQPGPQPEGKTKAPPMVLRPGVPVKNLSQLEVRNLLSRLRTRVVEPVTVKFCQVDLSPYQMHAGGAKPKQASRA